MTENEFSNSISNMNRSVILKSISMQENNEPNEMIIVKNNSIPTKLNIKLNTSVSLSRIVCSTNSNTITKIQFTQLMKINVILSGIISISTATFMYIFAFYGGSLIWLIANMDILVNNISCFIILKSNRDYMKHICCCVCRLYEHMRDQYNQREMVANDSPSDIKSFEHASNRMDAEIWPTP